jgi:hypothetical protein
MSKSLCDRVGSASAVLRFPCVFLPAFIMAGAMIHWRITFENVQDPGEMKNKLEDSLTLRRCKGLAVRIEGVDLVCSFLSCKSEKNIKKDICQTFVHFGKYGRYVITKETGQRRNSRF